MRIRVFDWLCAVLFLLRCHATPLSDAGWVRRNDHVYYFSGNTKRTWSEAKQDCASRDAYLVTVNGKEENDFLYTSTIVLNGYWIGLHCPGDNTCSASDLSWVSGNSDFTNFEVEDGFVVIRYVYLDFFTRQWQITNERNKEYRYICEKDNTCLNSDKSCKNGGTCSPHNRLGYSCNCPSGYKGDRCQTRLYCAPHPCVHGSCIEGSNTYICNCGNSGYMGVTCERDIDECREEGQHNCNLSNGRCRNTIGSYRCDCDAGWADDRCQTDINECGSDPCQHGATCFNTLGSYRCRCAEGYRGQNCSREINECDSNPCANGGTCTDLVNSYNCSCPLSITGARCEVDADGKSRKKPEDPEDLSALKDALIAGCVILVVVFVAMVILLIDDRKYARRMRTRTRHSASRSRRGVSDTSDAIGCDSSADTHDVTAESGDAFTNLGELYPGSEPSSST